MEYIFGKPIHPIAVHFVVALSFFAAALELWAFARKDRGVAGFAMLTTSVATAAICIAVLAGWYDHLVWHHNSEHGHDGTSVMNLHMNLGLVLALLFTVIAFLRLRTRDSVSTLYLALLLTGVIGIGYQAWLGGQLVYIEGIGVQTSSAGGKGVQLKESQPADHHDSDEDHHHPGKP